MDATLPHLIPSCWPSSLPWRACVRREKACAKSRLLLQPRRGCGSSVEEKPGVREALHGAPHEPTPGDVPQASAEKHFLEKEAVRRFFKTAPHRSNCTGQEALEKRRPHCRPFFEPALLDYPPHSQLLTFSQISMPTLGENQ